MILSWLLTLRTPESSDNSGMDFSSQTVFTTISVIKFTVYILDFVLPRYCH